MGDFTIEDFDGAKTDADSSISNQSIIDMIKETAEPFDDIEAADTEALLERIGDAKVVLLGEASHGTAEFYDMRAHITKALIQNKGFSIVAVEADWPDAAYINRYIKNTDTLLPDREPFTRFPTWMWRNRQVYHFINWLKNYNDDQQEQEEKTGFYGLDLYSMYESIEAVINYLEKIDPKLADIARERYGCLTRYESNPSAYGAAAMSGRYKECEDNVLRMLQELHDNRLKLLSRDGTQFQSILQNAKVVANAEEYYRSMYRDGSHESWNRRDSHMFETLESLLEKQGAGSKAVVWAHNSHVGNAASTEMGKRGEHNIGQLAREKFGDHCYAIGFGTDRGTVAAATDWGREMEIKNVRPSKEKSYEQLMHQTKIDHFMLPLHKKETLTEELKKTRLERAIGVIYWPQNELQSHYFKAVLPGQFDEYIWLDETRAVDLFPSPESEDKEEIPETFPFGV